MIVLQFFRYKSYQKQYSKKMSICYFNFPHMSHANEFFMIYLYVVKADCKFFLLKNICHSVAYLLVNILGFSYTFCTFYIIAIKLLYLYEHKEIQTKVYIFRKKYIIQPETRVFGFTEKYYQSIFQRASTFRHFCLMTKLLLCVNGNVCSYSLQHNPSFACK